MVVSLVSTIWHIISIVIRMFYISGSWICSTKYHWSHKSQIAIMANSDYRAQRVRSTHWDLSMILMSVTMYPPSTDLSPYSMDSPGFCFRLFTFCMACHNQGTLEMFLFSSGVLSDAAGLPWVAYPDTEHFEVTAVHQPLCWKLGYRDE